MVSSELTTSAMLPLTTAPLVPEKPAESAPVVVTATGPAAARAEQKVLPSLAANHKHHIRFVDTRSSVVLFIVDGKLEPTRAELATVTAVSQATGRIAVGLYCGDVQPGCELSVTHADAWRAAVPAQIPVGGLDSKMVRTLTLLNAGPASSISPSFAQQRRAHLAEMYLQQKEWSAQQVATIHHRQRQQAAAAVMGAISALVETADRAGITRDVLMKPEQRINRLYRVASRSASNVAGSVADAAGHFVGDSQQLNEDTFAGPFPVVEPRNVPPWLSSVDLVMSIFMLGAAASIGRLLSAPLEWLGVGESLAQAAGICCGLLLAAAAIALTIRRKAQAALRQWFADYLSQLRNAWDGEVATVLAECSASIPDWRLAQLNEQLRGDRGR